MINRYDLDEWSALMNKGKRIFNFNYRMNGDEIKEWSLINVVNMENQQANNEIVYLWEKNGSKGEELLRIGITENKSWNNSHTQMKETLENCMRPDIPRGADKLATIGDILYANQSSETKIVGDMFFCRGNITISINSVGEKITDVSTIGSNLDHALSTIPTTVTTENKLSEKLKRKETRYPLREDAPLIENLSVNTKKQGWIKIVAPDGELFQKDDTLFYKTDKKGQKAIALFFKSDDDKTGKVELNFDID